MPTTHPRAVNTVTTPHCPAHSRQVSEERSKREQEGAHHAPRYCESNRNTNAPLAPNEWHVTPCFPDPHTLSYRSAKE